MSDSRDSYTSTNHLSVLVVEDDDNLRSSLVNNLEREGYNVSSASSGTAGLAQIAKSKFEIVLCDLKLPDMDGLFLLKKMRASGKDSAVILMTAFGSVDIAVQALRHGAYDYISKPFSLDELILTLRKVEEREQLRSENAELKCAITQKYNFSNIIAQSDNMKEIFETIKRLASFNTTILITGESGTGKELIARAIHHNSPRRNKPFIAINCGAIPENLMESELFGHRKGAFTDASRDKKGLFEEANGGTIFLDEIGELPLHLQVKLLRALQEQQIRRVGDEEMISIDIRVIAATLRDLEDDIDQGRFRDDLFYRLNVVSLHIPPLRDRPEDIPLLVEHFTKKHSKSLGIRNKSIDPDAMRCLAKYYWRGNVRELENCIERSLVLSDGETITLESLPEQIRNFTIKREIEDHTTEIANDNLSIKQRTRALEIDLMLKALRKTGGNRTHAARILEISHRALLYKLKEYGLSEEKEG